MALWQFNKVIWVLRMVIQKVSGKKKEEDDIILSFGNGLLILCSQSLPPYHPFKNEYEYK